MKINRKKISLLLALLVFAGMFAGCVNEVAESEEPLPEISDSPEEAKYFVADTVFSLNYNSQYSLNPMATTSADNVLCTQLMYDNIYEVDSAFTASSDIIKEAKTDDGVYWTFTVDTSIEFWDGSTLTAYDVAYSIQRAQQSSRLRNRISSIFASAYSDEMFAITLQYGANMQLPALLTIPIIKNESVDETAPMGTGPFMPNEDFTELTLFSGHRNAGSIPISVVYLKEITEIDEAITAFENSEIDLVTNDPTGLLNLGYGSANDARYYPTTNMHYLGFNTKSLLFSSPLCRKAMTHVVNRDYIVNNIMGGAAIEAALPINPSSPLYNAAYSELIAYSVKKSEEALDAAEVQDYDDDGYRERLINGIPMETDTVFIVCSDNTQKVAAAQSITDNLVDLGIKVTLKALPWDNYVAALNNGDFDMYYAETMMTADFDPSILMLSGKSLNYGKFNDSVLADRIKSYLSSSDAERKKNADLMNLYITENAPIVTICFERHQVITHRGVISNMKPSQYNVFHNIREWTVNLG